MYLIPFLVRFTSCFITMLGLPISCLVIFETSWSVEYQSHIWQSILQAILPNILLCYRNVFVILAACLTGRPIVEILSEFYLN